MSGRSAIAASATSYASSTVCGTIVLAVCSRSQGQSRRRRFVSSCSSRSESASVKRLRRGGGGAGRGRRRLVADLEVRLRLELLGRVVDPLPHLLLFLLSEELLLDRCLHFGQLRHLLRLDRRQRLDHVPAVGRLDGLPELVGLEREGDLVELGHLAALRDRELATRVLRARVGGVLLGERREARAVQELLVDLVGERLLLDEDV